ncbi:MAG: TlpA disulfide reductase family protein [Ginsengibacter sp.]
MQKLTLISVLAMLCLHTNAQKTPALKPLSIGDAVPDIVFNNVINYKDSTIRLSDFKGKLVILDFWAPYCASCIKVFPKIDSLQEKYHDQIQFISVAITFGTGKFGVDAVKTLFPRLRNEGRGKYNFPVVVYTPDQLLELFPHQGFPFYAWIDKNRKAYAFTGYQLLDAQTIEIFLRNY